MKHSRRKKRSLIVPVVSMGDIAFLLIIFFMLCSHFAKEAGKNVTPPRSPDIDELEMRDHMVIIDAEGKIWVDGAEVATPDSVEAVLSDVLDPDAPEQDKHVQLRVDADAPQELYLPVMESMAKAGAIIDATGDKGEKKDKDRQNE